ncbi:C39 family peptidase [Bacillus sp. V33-4]|uniref:C39 family peptidase n=1 Tax=Bacillus sp. V33-4 TaxID=2054169 RepID=UPI000C7931F1|nr:C39 family peptidase [Bacillus sp. V33-4]PLR80533.1 peptidase C39 [Bacillus sp. V33-4]
MQKVLLIASLLPLLGCSPDQANDDNNHKAQALVTSSEYSTVGYPESQVQRKPIKMSQKKLLDVPLIKQNPELKYGCEVTSLAMMLQYAGVETTKWQLYEKIVKDNDPLIKSRDGDILKWGNPARGFVGDMTGTQAGYAVFDEPMIDLINRYLPRSGVNLTGKDFNEVLRHVSDGYPVVVWTTGDYRVPDRWESWQHGNEQIETPLDLHAVVIVGYDERSVYINDPLSGKKQVQVNKEQFISSWEALEKRAVSFRIQIPST